MRASDREGWVSEGSLKRIACVCILRCPLCHTGVHTGVHKLVLRSAARHMCIDYSSTRQAERCIGEGAVHVYGGMQEVWWDVGTILRWLQF